MLRMSCKECAQKNKDYYESRQKTGEIIDVRPYFDKETQKFYTKKVIKCSNCGHIWFYYRKKKHYHL